MSATIGNLEETAKFLNAELYSRNFRPVQLKEYVKFGNEIWLVDTEQDDILVDKKLINYKVGNDFRIFFIILILFIL